MITLVRGAHGIFYGTDRETVFAMTETGVRTTLCAVPDCFSVSPLIQADDGSLYGVGGSSTLYGAGNVFRVTPVAFAPTSVIIGNRRGSGVRLTWAAHPAGDQLPHQARSRSRGRAAAGDRCHRHELCRYERDAGRYLLLRGHGGERVRGEREFVRSVDHGWTRDSRRFRRRRHDGHHRIPAIRRPLVHP